MTAICDSAYALPAFLPFGSAEAVMLRCQEERSLTVGQLLALSDEELVAVDPVMLNLLVAKGIPALCGLGIGRYVRIADEWAGDLGARMPALEMEFRQAPHHWRNDIDYFRLGLVCWYVDIVLGIAYREDQRNASRILYTDPTDLFLNGVMDTRRGTCGNLAMLHVVLGRRIGLPVSLACIGSHFLCRFDDGKKTFNIEPTETGRGGFSSQTDEYVLAKHNVPAKALACGSDLRAVTPREMLGLLLGLRARHFENTLRMAEAERDYLFARYLFPRNRQLYIAQNQVSVQWGAAFFEPGEKGHPIELASWLQEVIRVAQWTNSKYQTTFKLQIPTTPPISERKEKRNVRRVDAIFQEIIVDGNFK